MRRPRLSVPLPIRGLLYNQKFNCYTVIEREICYHLQLEHTRLLKQFFKGDSSPYTNGRVAEWFNQLDLETKREINRTGNLADNSFTYYDGHHSD